VAPRGVWPFAKGGSAKENGVARNISCSSVSVRRLKRAVEACFPKAVLVGEERVVDGLAAEIKKQQTVDGESEHFLGSDSEFAQKLPVSAVFRKFADGEPQRALLGECLDDPVEPMPASAATSDAEDESGDTLAAWWRQRKVGNAIFRELRISPSFGTWKGIDANEMDLEWLERGQAIADEFAARYGRLQGDLGLAGFMRLLGSYFINHWPWEQAIMNIHPSLLPSFPGLHAQAQALAYGAKISGCTVHFVDEGMDTGPVIIQRSVPVLADDTEESLSERILREEHIAYPEAIKLWAEDRLSAKGRLVTIK
jgi:formyltetrahydrofolate-dependent phosphoribosylglycinamide formyltransferase